jgi:hypothetical protein
MTNQSTLSPVNNRTRRNIIRGGAILASVVAANVTAIETSLSGQNGQGQNGQGQNSKAQCLLRGTTIQTAGGNRKIEDLAVGDLLPTLFSGQRPIQWSARYRFKKSDRSKPWVKDPLPIRISRSALAPDVPRADIYITGGHSVFIDGLLAPVGDLINGTSIVRDELACDELEFFHIKLENHDVIYAEGAPVDTLLRVDESAINFAEYFRRYGMPEGARDALRSVRYLWWRTWRTEVEDP